MKKRFLVIIIIFILLLGILLIFNKKKNDESLIVFFFKNNQEKFILYDNEGNKISDIEYDNVLDYVLDSTLVYKDSKVSVLDKNGKYLVKENEYDEIIRYAAFYKATKDDRTFLLDNKGKIIKDITSSKIVSFKGAQKYIILEDDESYEVVLYDGKEVYKFVKDNDVLPTVNQLDNLASIFYKNLTIIFDTTNGDIINTVDDNIHYCIKEKNDNIILLNSCTNTYQEKVKYKVSIDNDIKKIPEMCDSVSLSGENILCENETKKQLLDNELNVKLDVTSSISYIDYNNYIKEVDGKVEFYNNNKLVKKVDNATIKNFGYQNDNYYILNINELYYYYDDMGNLKIDNGFSEANSFDKNSFAVVVNNSKEYLIDKNGNKKSDGVESIVSFSDFYIIKSEYIGLLNKDGNRLLKSEYDNINLLSDNKHDYALLTKDNKYSIYDIDNDKIVGTYNSEVETFNYYYKVDNKYYTYNGKEIYESK